LYSTEPKVAQTGANVLTIEFDEIAQGWEQWFMLSSDRHHDSIKCDRELQKKHLEKVNERNAYILDVGDFFDAMQGRYDPRRSYGELRPEYKSNTYLDDIVKDAAAHFGPYAKRLLLLGRGNHDTTVIKNNGTDILSSLAHRLNSDYGGNVQVGGYGGWVRFMFKMRKTVRMSKRLKYFHGAGGGGPVTRGVIQTNRQAVYLPDADIIVNGHTHDTWVVPIARERLSEAGKIGADTQWHLRVPTYSDDYGDGSGGWHVERWGPPKPRGCMWLRLYYDPADGIKFEPVIDIA
jgi:outer membrane protein OmpA-like peptidoglycan-associated protein